MRNVFIFLLITLIGCRTNNYKQIKTDVVRKRGGIIEVFKINNKSDSFGQSGFSIRKYPCKIDKKTKITFLFYEIQNRNEHLQGAFVYSKKRTNYPNQYITHGQTLAIKPQKAKFQIDFIGFTPVLTNKFNILKGDSVVIQTYLVSTQYFVH